MPVDVPAELLREQYPCRDCAEERGDEGLNPGDAYAWVRAPKYRLGFRRTAYCRRHQSIRNGRAQKARMQRPEAKAKRRAWDRANWTRYIATRYAAYRSYYRRNRAKRAAAYAEWAAANPEKRRASQEAWRERRKLRGRPVAVRPKLRPEDGGNV